MVAVDDVVNVMYQLMNSTINGERFALVATNKTFEDVLNLIADTLQLKRPFIYANRTFTSFAWRVDWFLSKLLQKKRVVTKATARASHGIKTFDCTKVKNTLNYSFVDMSEYLENLLPKL